LGGGRERPSGVGVFVSRKGRFFSKTNVSPPLKERKVGVKKRKEGGACEIVPKDL